MAEIKKITVGSTTYDISAKYLLDSQGNKKSWEDVTALVEAGFDIVVLNNLPYPTSSTTWDDIYAEYHNDLVLVPQETPGEDNHYDEYVIQKASLADATSYPLPSQYSMDVLFTILGAEPPTSYETIYEDSYSNSVSVKFDNANAKGIIKHTVSGSSIYYVYSLQSRSGDWYSNEAGTTPYTGILEFNYHKPNIYEDFTRLFAFVSGSNDAYGWEKIGSTDVDLSNYVQKGIYITEQSYGDTGYGGAETITVSYTGNATGSGTISYDKATSIDSHTIAAHSHTVNAATTSIEYVTGVKSTGGTTEVVTGVGANGTVTAVTSVSANGSADVIDSITTGTTTVATEGIKTVGLTSSSTSSTGAITYVESISGSAPAMSTATGYATVFISTITGFSGGSKAADTFVANTPTTIDTSKFSGGSFTQGAKASFTQGAKATLSYSTLSNVMQSATVTDGVLSWTTATVSNISSWSANGNDTFTPNGNDSFTAAALASGFYTAGSAASFTEGTFTAASLGTVTTKSVGITGGSYTATTKYVKPSTTAAGTASVINSVTSTTTSVLTGITSNTATVLTGVKATGTATVILNTGLTTSSKTVMTGATLGTAGATTLAHSINYTTTTITVSIQVPIDHEHTINTSDHTHSLGNHTHDIDLTIDPESSDGPIFINP